MGVHKGKPVVYRCSVADSSSSFEEHSPIDLRDVLEYLAPEVMATFRPMTNFSLPDVIKKFDAVMAFMIATPSSQGSNGHNGHEEQEEGEDDSEESRVGERNLVPDRYLQPEVAPLNANQNPGFPDRILKPPVYDPKTCILDLDIHHLGIFIQLFPTAKRLNGYNSTILKHLMTSAIQKVFDQPDNERAIKEYLLLPIAALSTKAAEGFKTSNALQFLQNGDWSKFTIEAFAKRRPPALNEETRKMIKTKIADEYLRMGGISKAYATSVRKCPREAVAPEALLNFFVSIHPRREYDIEPMTEATRAQATPISHTQTLSGIRRGRPLRAPGIASLRLDHLKAMTKGEEFDAPSLFLISFSKLINMVGCAKLPPSLAYFLYQTQGIGIPKEPTGVRPIGMRDVHVNLALNILMKDNGKDIVNTFKDCNFALNGPKGIDKAIIHCNLWREILPHQDSVFVDGTSAYQLVRRDVSLRCSKEYLPGMAPILHAIHENSSRIWLQQGEDTPVGVLTSEGTTQGCGGGTITFAFGTKELYDGLQETAREAPDPAYFNGYSDDGNTGATTETACAMLAQYQTEGPTCGVTPNISKTFVLLGVNGSEEEVDTAINMYTTLGVRREKIRVHPANGGDVEEYGTEHLGVPVGSDEYIKRWLDAKLAVYTEEVEKLMEVENPQHKWIFLYYCFARKPSYVLRHVLPSLSEAFCTGFDALLKRAFESVINMPVNDTQWKQIMIPIKHGGCGLPSMRDVALAAFTANALENREYVLRRLPEQVVPIIDPHEEGDSDSRFTREFESCLRNAKAIYLEQGEDRDGETREEQWEHEYGKHLEGLSLQYFFTNIMTRQGKNEIKETLNDPSTRRENAIFLSVAKQHTGDFLLTCPKTPAVTFQPQDFIMALRIRLGCELNNIPTRCTCTKKPFLEPKGIHLLHCAKGGSLIHRHDAVQQEVKALAISAGVQASSCCKDVVVLNQAGGDMRRGDLMLPQCGKNNMNLLLDFTFTHPASKSSRAATINDPSSSIRRANMRKNNKYKERAEANDIDFMPMALECYGALSKEFVNVMQMLCQKRSEITGCNKSVLMQYWYRRISCTVHKGNSRAISKRCMEITQEDAGASDECYDCAIDHEFGNTDTVNLHR